MKKTLVSLTAVMLVAFASTANAGPITFGSATDYDNSANQTTGLFRDVLNGERVSTGGHLVNGAATGAYTALNFTGQDSNTATSGVTTVYDANPGTLTPTFFSGDISLSADILIDPFNNAKGAGLMTLFNEGDGQQGLSVFLWDAGNTDRLRLNVVEQTGTTRPITALQTTVLSDDIPDDEWFRLAMSLQFTGPSSFTVTATVFAHSDPTNPNSSLGAEVGSLVYNGVLSATLQNPYEIGIVARADGGALGASVTNFWASSVEAQTTVAAVPEPGSVILLVTGLLGLAARRHFRR